MTQRKIALSIEEAADYTGIGRNTLRQLVEWKKLPVLKVGRKVLIKTDILEMFMEANEGHASALPAELIPPELRKEIMPMESIFSKKNNA